jgi:phospholipid/cholesterol/gamma-HCH transport system permease protein
VSALGFAWAEARGVAHLLAETARAVVRERPASRVVLNQAFDVGNRSVFFILVTLGFLGAILNFQTGFQAQRIFGDTSLIGAATLPILVRQLGPTLVGLMVAIRVGTGIAAEIGSMVVTEQVDALRMCGAGPVDYLVKPRVLAGLIAVPALWVLGTGSAWMAGLWVTQLAFQTNPTTYINLDLTRGADVADGARGLLEALAALGQAVGAGVGAECIDGLVREGDADVVGDVAELELPRAVDVRALGMHVVGPREVDPEPRFVDGAQRRRGELVVVGLQAPADCVQVGGLVPVPLKGQVHLLTLCMQRLACCCELAC